MKTYILRDPQSVQPQNAHGPEPPAPETAAPAKHRVRAGSGPALYIGLDVHTDSIAVSLAPSDSSEVRRYGLIGGTHEDVLRLAKKLQAAHPGVTLRFVYEAGPHGYPLCRCLRAHHYDCIITPPSKIPRAPGAPPLAGESVTRGDRRRREREFAVPSPPLARPPAPVAPGDPGNRRCARLTKPKTENPNQPSKNTMPTPASPV